MFPTRPSTFSLILSSRKDAIIGLGRQGWPFGATPRFGFPRRWTRWKTISLASSPSFIVSLMKLTRLISHCSQDSSSGSGMFRNIRFCLRERASKSINLILYEESSSCIDVCEIWRFSISQHALLSFVFSECTSVTRVSTTHILLTRKLSLSESLRELTSILVTPAYDPCCGAAEPPVLLRLLLAALSIFTSGRINVKIQNFRELTDGTNCPPPSWSRDSPTPGGSDIMAWCRTCMINLGAFEAIGVEMRLFSGS